MFLAYSIKERRNLFADESALILSHYKNKGDLVCPQTKAPVTYVRQAKNGRRPHFRIHDDATLEQKEAYNELHKQGGKGVTHHQCQGYLIERLIERNKTKVLAGEIFFLDEYRIGSRIADIAMIEVFGERKAITVYEVQFSPITLAEVQARTQDYLDSENVVDVWWFFEKDRVANKAFKEYLQNIGCTYGTVKAIIKEEVQVL